MLYKLFTYIMKCIHYIIEHYIEITSSELKKNWYNWTKRVTEFDLPGTSVWKTVIPAFVSHYIVTIVTLSSLCGFFEVFALSVN